MHNKQIKRYTQDGEIGDDKDFIRLRQMFEELLVETMRSEGYLPINDLRSQWFTQWTGKKYSFNLCMFGMYAGPRKAYEFDFWHDWRLVKIGGSILGSANNVSNTGTGD